MILTDLQGYVRRERCVSLDQLARHFDASPDALRGMLDRLVARGRVRRLPRPAMCAGCAVCPDEKIEFYAAGERVPPRTAAVDCPRS